MILLTGSNGFISRHLLHDLKNKKKCKLLGRGNNLNAEFDCYYQKEVNSKEDYKEVLCNVSCIVHCAARVHLMTDDSLEPLEDYREVNTAGSLNLARQAVEAGVKRFIFLSSIKVNGEATQLGKPFTSGDARQPEDDYGQSKSEAEEQLLQLAEETGLEVVIIRPTLVYGPGVKANFASLMSLVSKGSPLPFGAITNNKRSLVSVKNLVDLIVTCIDHPKAVNQVFLVSDDNDLSTASMVKHMATALGKANRLLPIPLWCYHLLGKLCGKQNVVERLLGSLQVDISHTRKVLDWKPPQTVEEGFKETADAFLKGKKI